MIRQNTLDLINVFKLEDDKGLVIPWTEGQLEIIDSIVNRSATTGQKRVQIIAATQYGKSLAVGAGLVLRAVHKPEKWALVAGTKEKARIIMEYVIMFSLNNEGIRTRLNVEESLDRLRMRKSQDRITYKSKGEIRAYSADASRITQTSKSLMGFGSPNVVEDESALIPDKLQATVMRMLGGDADNFLVKIGNPFENNHFRRTWDGHRYHRIFIDYVRALEEGRFTQDFIEEMREEPFFDILYECKFPSHGLEDEKGWNTLLSKDEVDRAMVEDFDMFGQLRLGADVAGGGRNYSAIVLRGANYARRIYKKREPDTMIFATNLLRFGSFYKVKDRHHYIDKVGIGKGAFDKLRNARDSATGVNGGDSPADIARFKNLRAEMYWRTREWILRGGKLQKDKDWYQLCDIKYKADVSGRLKLMTKEEMLRNQIDSPDIADSLAMTFVRKEAYTIEGDVDDTTDDSYSPELEEEDFDVYA